MKKLLFILFITTAAIYGCKKDTSTKVNVTSSDIAVINGQLKGLWLFPTNNQVITDQAGKTLASNGYINAPALQFDGGSGVTIITNLQIKSQGTYQLSTKNGLIYLDITDKTGTDVTYQVLSATSQTLRIVSKTPYVFYNGDSPIQAQTVSNIVLQKETSADVTGNLVKVVVDGEAAFNIGVFVTHTMAADTPVLLDSKQNVKGTYSFAFPTKSGDQLNAVVDGDYSETAFYAYYNGVPLTGDLSYGAQEFKTTSGWKVP